MIAVCYADYNYYTDIFGGGIVPEQYWTEVSREASAYIDRITYQRLKDGAEVTDDVKNAVCAVAQVLYRYGNSDRQHEARIASESVSGRSISYINVSEYSQQKQTELQNVADLYLPLSNPLRYAGVS